MTRDTSPSAHHQQFARWLVVIVINSTGLRWLPHTSTKYLLIGYKEILITNAMELHLCCCVRSTQLAMSVVLDALSVPHAGGQQSTTKTTTATVSSKHTAWYPHHSVSLIACTGKLTTGKKDSTYMFFTGNALTHACSN